MPKVNREDFLHALEAVQPGLAPKEFIQQSSAFVFSEGEVITYNEEVSCQSKTSLDGIKGAVPSAPLLNILRKLQEEEVDIEVTGSEMVVTGKKRRAGIFMEKEILLPLDSLEKPNGWKKLPGDFTDAVNLVKQCTGKNESEIFRTSVHLHPERIEAGDGYQLCRWDTKLDIKHPFLVRASSIQAVSALGVTDVSQGEAWLHFRNGRKTTISCRHYPDVGDYPDCSKELEISGKKANLPKGLAEAMEKAEIFSSENADNNLVMVRLTPGKVRIRGQGPSGWYSEIKTVKYDGPSMSFMIAPKVLSDIVKRHDTCYVSRSKLRVRGESYRYLTCLTPTKEEESE